MQLTGIHHLTAISAKPRENLAFYTGLLGMRLVKKTVNQDDVSAYHLFYADGKANPGTDLTFFDFPAAPERRGTNSISRTGLRVAGEKSLGFWRDRLKQAGLPHRRGHRSRRPADAAVRGWRRPAAGAGR
jgi:glyoxalase family protein